jgi:hypothetical protein
MRRWLLWIPILMVASLVYWTVALGLGGVSLMAMSALSSGGDEAPRLAAPAPTDSETGGVGAPRDGYEPILVRIEESEEPEDVDDNAGCGFTEEVVGAPEAGAPTAEIDRADSGERAGVSTEP